jgi:hypothetical protein
MNLPELSCQKTKLQSEHRIDSSSRVLGRRLSAFKRGESSRLGGRRRSRSASTRRGNIRRSSRWLDSNLLKVSQIARFFRTRLHGGKRQIHLVLHGAGDAVQLPDELFELFRPAKVQAALPQKADGQHHQNGQADGQGGENDVEKQRLEGCEGLAQWGLQTQDSAGRIQQRASADKRIDFRPRAGSPRGCSQISRRTETFISGYLFTPDHSTRSRLSAGAIRSASPRNTVLFSPAIRAVVPV